ncbi:MAG: 50S ribosomal protein L3 [Deltaproteobacteria bacterium]|nr:50S ribosomal protein L3 [Deltaproteobacteria bacterium]
MNQNLGMVGRKVGMTQVFEADGTVRQVTAVEAGPCVVIQKRTPQKDGYSALALGFGEKPDRLVKQPQRKQFEKAGTTAKRVIREFRLAEDIVAKYEVGQQIKVDDVFAAGDFVDVAGTSIGRGFTGVMRRWNFKGGRMTHGTHEYRRHGGSIGQNMTPGRTWPNKGMPGQHGNVRRSVMSLRVARVLPDENVILVEGGVPGHVQGLVEVRGAAKRPRKA